MKFQKKRLLYVSMLLLGCYMYFYPLETSTITYPSQIGIQEKSDIDSPVSNLCDTNDILLWQAYHYALINGEVKLHYYKFKEPLHNNWRSIGQVGGVSQQYQRILRNKLHREGFYIKFGGEYEPNFGLPPTTANTEMTPFKRMINSSSCTNKETLAILVPYRKREKNLRRFLAYMHRYLPLQRRSYRIFLLEQDRAKKFNRAKLFNAGLREIAFDQIQVKDKVRTEANVTGDVSLLVKHKNTKFSCFALHDVDRLPRSLNLTYTCVGDVTQLTTSLSITTRSRRQRNVPFYLGFMGSVTLFKREALVRINGASNCFYGWGGEDDDLYQRVMVVGLPMYRASIEEGAYYSLVHPSASQINKKRLELLKPGRVFERLHRDGMMQTEYQLQTKYETPLYTYYRFRL